MRGILICCISVIFLADYCLASESGGPVRQPRPGDTRPEHSFGFVSEVTKLLDLSKSIAPQPLVEIGTQHYFPVPTDHASKTFYGYPVWTCGYLYGDRFINQMDVYGGEKETYYNWFFFREDGIYNRTGSNANEFEFQLDRKWLVKESPKFECEEEGKFGGPKDCDIFHVCQAYDGRFVHDKFNCPSGTVYCVAQDVCG